MYSRSQTAISSAADSIRNALSTHVEQGELAGAVALTWREGHAASVVAVGRRDLVASEPMERDTIFRIASMTKPVTAVAALQLFDDGAFGVDDPISTHAPELATMHVLREPEGPLDDTVLAAQPITFRDLLTHRSGLTYAEFHRGPIGRASAAALGPTIDNRLSPDEWIAQVATLPLIDQPGAAFHYGISSDLLGFLVARIEGAPLGAVLERRVFNPLAMHDTGFSVPVAKHHRRADLCGFDDTGRLTSLPTTPGDHALRERPGGMTFESGGQGLWSTADDYLAFARMLLGDPGVARLLRPETLAMMTSNQLTSTQRASARLLGRPVFAQGHGYGMGVAVVMEPDQADALRCRGSVGTLGWPGAYGGWWQADPIDRSVLIFLTHSMAELSQMARGIGLGAWSAIRTFHALGTS